MPLEEFRRRGDDQHNPALLLGALVSKVQRRWMPSHPLTAYGQPTRHKHLIEPEEISI
jgi:hypothetical protein